VLAGLLAVGAVLALWPRTNLVAPAPTALLTDRRGAVLGEAAPPRAGDMGYWPLVEVPARLELVTRVAEDRRLGWHPGVDPLAVLRAGYQNWSQGRRVSGASTLAMQVARMQSPGARSWPRKLLEAATAVGITLRHGPDAVLRHYLRLTPYGRRVRGIRYAARRYFGKPVGDLGWAELAFLTALPQAPGRRDPGDPRGRERAVARAERILDALEEGGHLAPGERTDASERLARLTPAAWEDRPEAALHPLLRISEDPTRPRAGTVRTTLDLPLQAEVQALVAEAVHVWERAGVGSAAVVVVERDGARVRAAVGSAGYFDSAHAGAIDFTREPRSSGSTLKPFLYALALERGVIGPTTILDDLRRAPGGLENSDDRFLGPLLPRQALGNSRNVPVARLVADLGLEEVASHLARLRLHEGARPPEHYGAGIGLGTLPVRLDDLVAAYLSLAEEGWWRPLSWWEERPEARQGPSWVAPSRPGHRVMTEATARRIVRWLADPAARLPTFRRRGNLEYPFPVAVKTGTSSRRRDAWCVGLTRRYVVGAWVGHPDARPMGPGMRGSGPAAFLVRAVLMSLHEAERDGLSRVGFPGVPGARAVRVCGITGDRATRRCEGVVSEDLRPGEVPGRTCQAHRAGAGPALVLPARYAEWAAGRAGAAVGGDGEGPRPSDDWRIRITAPEPGLVVRPDPEAPRTATTLALSCVADPPPPSVLWYVDGELFQEVGPPYAARWPLEAGTHRIEARIPYTDLRAGPVTVRVLE
jgi:penicillin-binding protein 1C